MCDENSKEYKFGNERFGGSYRPGNFELNFPDDLTSEEFEEMFKAKMESLHKIGREFMPFDEEPKSKKEKLKPLSIRVKAHTKDFFKNNSILTAREVLELYEDFNNGSEAFINSLLEDEKQLEQELAEIQEKLHNAKLFKDKLNDLNIEKSEISDDDKISSLKESYKNTEIKVFEDNPEDIKTDIQLYNTKKVVLHDSEYLEINAANDLIPVIYYFKNDFNPDDLVKVIADVKSLCESLDIEYLSLNGDE